MKKVFFIITCFLATSCSSDDSSTLNNQKDELINTWVESHEEEYGVFRPSDYKIFPKSIFRQSYTFMENNKCEYLVLSPVDAHYIDKGLWEYNEENNSIYIYNLNNKLIHELKIITLASNILQLDL